MSHITAPKIESVESNDKYGVSLAYGNISETYTMMKDYGKAVDAYQQIIAMGETFESEDAYLGLGRCYERLGKKKEVLENYKAYLKTAKKSDGMRNVVLRQVSLLEK